MANQEEMSEIDFKNKFLENSKILREKIDHNLLKNVSTEHHDIGTISNGIAGALKFEEAKSNSLRLVRLRRKLTKKRKLLYKVLERAQRARNHKDIKKYYAMRNEIAVLEDKLKKELNKPVDCGSRCKFCWSLRKLFNLNGYFHYGK